MEKERIDKILLYTGCATCTDYDDEYLRHGNNTTYFFKDENGTRYRWSVRNGGNHPYLQEGHSYKIKAILPGICINGIKMTYVQYKQV